MEMRRVHGGPSAIYIPIIADWELRDSLILHLGFRPQCKSVISLDLAKIFCSLFLTWFEFPESDLVLVVHDPSTDQGLGPSPCFLCFLFPKNDKIDKKCQKSTLSPTNRCVKHSHCEYSPSLCTHCHTHASPGPAACHSGD